MDLIAFHLVSHFVKKTKLSLNILSTFWLSLKKYIFGVQVQGFFFFHSISVMLNKQSVKVRDRRSVTAVII